jgi:hypothetical protein
MDMEDYLNATNYEYFLSRAFRFDKRLTPPNKQEFLNLINAEKGITSSFLPKFEKQREGLKHRLTTAIDIFISKSEDEEQKTSLKILLIKVNQINSSNDIPEITKVGLEITQNFIL